MTVAFLLYGPTPDARDAFHEEKYRQLAEYFQDRHSEVVTVSYGDANSAEVAARLAKADFTLVWINPVEAGMDRDRLDRMLSGLLERGHRLSADPAVIVKLGTKNILFETADLPWGSDVKQYKDSVDFETRFRDSLAASGTRVLKQHRGDGGKGVFKVESVGSRYRVTQANDNTVWNASWDELKTLVNSYLSDGHPILDQEWNTDMRNGVVRCYLTGSRVVGFGYQEINMLYPWPVPNVSSRRRNYYTEHCGLFQDLKATMEQQIVPALAEKYQLTEDQLPILWDADHFIRGAGRYTLCEVNSSCVSPFPESAIPYVYDEVVRRCSSHI